ncbi:MAG: cytochrome c-type biogenesis CcmF C-terminal domain-containing protein, partial [Planctomycetota bacterium]
PVMLVHPPIVFLGYAGWAVPFALAIAALACGRLDAEWVHEARRWALFAWAVLGGGILLGAFWAYEELGWGGYWGWDPVENGSLIPWLTGTALLHTLMAWQYSGAFRKTSLWLAIATFALSNFATFLTRSGVFSSLHAFGESPIGWMFLGLVATLAIGGGGLIVARRSMLGANRRLSSIWSREAFVLIGVVSLLLLAAVALLGTLAAPISNILLGRSIVFGPAFYNNVLIPTGLLLLAATAAAPMLRWGNLPTVKRRRALFLCAAGGVLVVALALLYGVRRPIALAVTWSAALAVLAAAGSLILDAGRRKSDKLGLGLLRTLREARRQYAGFLIHLGFVCLAVGVTGSSLGTHRREVVIDEGQTIEWAGRSIRFVGLEQRELSDKLVAEAKLEVTPRGAGVADTLLPAQHLHYPQQEWTTEVAVHSTWGGDLYTILRGGEEDGSVNLTLVENPLMRFLWLGGWVMGAGALLGLWPARRKDEGGGMKDERGKPGILIHPSSFILHPFPQADVTT